MNLVSRKDNKNPKEVFYYLDGTDMGYWRRHSALSEQLRKDGVGPAGLRKDMVVSGN